MADAVAPARELLSRVPLLSSLDDEHIDALVQACAAIEARAGDIVFLKGDPADALYIVESGTMEAVLDEGTPSEHVVSSFVSGDFFGEMALLTGQPRSATVRARTHSRLLTLAKTQFDRAVADDPALALRLSQALSARLFDVNEQLSKRGSRICSVVAIGNDEETAALRERLLQSLCAQFGQAAVVVVPVGCELDGETDAEVAALLDRMRQRHRLVLVWTSSAIALRRRAALHRSVMTVVVGAGAAVAADVERTAAELSAGLGSPVRVAAPTQGKSGVDRLARVLAGTSVGLALSGGAAQGLAHLGVIEALVEADIPIDMIVGTSGGALYGSMIASGMSIGAAEARVISQTRRNLMDRIDLAVPRYGIIHGRRIERMVRDTIGDVTFADLPTPFRAVATDLENGDEVVLGDGPVHRAVRASISIPGIFEPVRIDGRLLVDGAVVTPLPVRPLRALGADLAIAVHVPAPGRVSDERKRAAGQRLDERHNLVNTIFRSYAFAGDVLAYQAGLEADVCIRPDVALFGWRDYKSADAIIHAGRLAGRAHVAQIRKQLTAAGGAAGKS